MRLIVFKMASISISCLLVTLNVLLCVVGCLGARSFTVDYDNNTFMKDGKPFRYVAGSIHYSRIPSFYWHDRLLKMYTAGLDAVQVYVPWNVHEPAPGVYNFDGDADIVKFIKTAHDIGLLVILRAGPYICGEWEFGGFPAWLLKDNPGVILRTMDPGYLKPVDRWSEVFLAKMEPLLYNNGGPIIMVQVENEYGSYFACDHDYTTHLFEKFRALLHDNVVFFTTDGDGTNFLKCGAINGTLTTVDFGPTDNVTKAFAPQLEWQPGAPRVNSEYYTGWLDYWGGNHAHGDTTSIVNSLKLMLDVGASVNMYMFEGGTNFGFTNGADPPFNICPTEYDYDAPMTEAGDITEKYTAIRQLIGQYKTLPSIPVPPMVPKYKYGKVSMEMVGAVLDILDRVQSKSIPMVESKYPLTMEQIGQTSGFILYHTVIPWTVSGGLLMLSAVRDMGYVMLDGVAQGLIDRKQTGTMNIVAYQGQTLDIFIENQGRINFGKDILNNTKGIIYNVTLDGEVLTDWSIYPLNFTQMFDYHTSHRRTVRSGQAILTPSVYTGQFTVPSSLSAPQDTYLNMGNGWFKGQAYVNGFNLGRYWPVRGPQVTLYVPANVLLPSPAVNHLLMIELQASPCPDDCTIELQDYPIINGTSAIMTENTSGRSNKQYNTLYYKTHG